MRGARQWHSWSEKEGHYDGEIPTFAEFKRIAHRGNTICTKGNLSSSSTGVLVLTRYLSSLTGICRSLSQAQQRRSATPAVLSRNLWAKREVMTVLPTRISVPPRHINSFRRNDKIGQKSLVRFQDPAYVRRDPCGEAELPCANPTVAILLGRVQTPRSCQPFISKIFASRWQRTLEVLQR